MIKEILLEGRTVKYDLQRKKVKNINIRVKRDLTVHVSASTRVSEQRIEAILKEKSRFILSALKKYENIARSTPSDTLQTDTITVFGQPLPITVVSGAKNQALIESDRIELMLKDISDHSGRQKVLDSALDSLLRHTVEDLCKRIYPKFSGHCPEYPDIKFRRMKSRWGSCNFKKYILTFNYNLIHAPVECIEYVVYHEFTHFIHPNHSRDFYKELEKYVAEHKSIRARLNLISIDR